MNALCFNRRVSGNCQRPRTRTNRQSAVSRATLIATHGVDAISSAWLRHPAFALELPQPRHRELALFSCLRFCLSLGLQRCWQAVATPLRAVTMLAFLSACVTTSLVHAEGFPAHADILLIAPDGTETPIGSVSFKQQGDNAAAIHVDVDGPDFTDHFLSMRPFRCLQGSSEWFCYLQYPYELRNMVTESDLADLEYQLLFLRKTPQEFGIDAWNGLYYDLTLQADQSITGTLLEGDLNSLQSPPEEKYSRPVDLFEFIEADQKKRLYPSLLLRPRP